MKKVVIILFLLVIPTLGFAQNDTTVVSTQTEKTEITTSKKETTNISKDATLSSAFKAKLNKLNHKKSNEIISIKAFRKSLKIKVKTVKLC